MKKLAMERRDFLKVGGGVVAGAAVGAVGSRIGSGMATDGQLAAVSSSRDLSGDEARAALELMGQPDCDRGHSQRLERVDVLPERALEREDPDLHATSHAPACARPRGCRRC